MRESLNKKTVEIHWIENYRDAHGNLAAPMRIGYVEEVVIEGPTMYFVVGEGETKLGKGSIFPVMAVFVKEVKIFP